MVVVYLAHELRAMKCLPFFTEQIKCTCISKTLEYAFNCSVSTKSWLSHTLCIPRNETQRKCSIFVNIDCVFSRLYCALIFVFIFFCCWYNMEVKTICYVVQYAVHMELCSTNLFSGFLVVYWYFFFFSIKFYWRWQVESSLCLGDNPVQHLSWLYRNTYHHGAQTSKKKNMRNYVGIQRNDTLLMAKAQ